MSSFVEDRAREVDEEEEGDRPTGAAAGQEEGEEEEASYNEEDDDDEESGQDSSEEEEVGCTAWPGLAGPSWCPPTEHQHPLGLPNWTPCIPCAGSR